MSARVAFPFLTLQDASVISNGWKIALGQGELNDAAEWLADWDSSIPIHISRTIGIDFAAAARDLDMETQDLKLVASLRIGTGTGRLPRAVIFREHQPFTFDAPIKTFDVVIDGSILSTVIDLHIDIAVASSMGSGGVLSPARKGDRVWNDLIRVRLEGEEPRLPIEVADLATILPGSAAFAPWYLDWSPRDWTRDFHGALRLYLNSKHRDIVGRIEAEDSEILRALMADLMGQVCESLVRDPDVESIIEGCGEGSLGAQASYWLKTAFPSGDMQAARAALEHRPGLFRAAMQALADQQAYNT